VRLDVYTQPSAFEELRSEWNDLLKRSPADTVFGTWEWHDAWWNIYQPGDLWIITCRSHDGRLIGLAPWFLDEDRVVRGIGCQDVTDYIDVIVDRDCIGVVLDQFASFLAQHHDNFTEIYLCNIPQGSPTLEHFPERLRLHKFAVDVEQIDVCPVIQLPEKWEDYLSGLDKKRRHELRRKMRRANGATEDLEFTTIEPAQELGDTIPQFLELMAASDTEKEEFLQNDRNRAFLSKVIEIAHEQGWLQLDFMKVNGEPAAAYLNFDYNRHILVYNSGLAREQFDHLSPGIVLLAHNIKQAIEDGYEVFDFLRGDETYKYHMGGQDIGVFALAASFNGN
jgi:CelD/BcsL family acetyltransferase involved in cellulose biosynthesis